MSISTGTFSRRSFIKSAAAAGALLAGASFATGCASESASKGASLANTSSDGAAPNIEVIDCDVLLIGAGLNGTHAANQIVAEGGKVTIVEKGPWRHSGLAGVSVDLFNISGMPNVAQANFTFTEEMMVNGDLVNKAAQFHLQNTETYARYDVNHGELIPTRNEDGSLEGFAGIDGCSQGLFFRRQQDRLDAIDSVSVYDRTMITELLVSDGKCCGAIGVHLPSGNLRVFRAKATISDTGGCVWFYGWQTVSANTCGFLENTADVTMAAWRHGCGIGESEFTGIDSIAITPRALAMGNGSNIDVEPADAVEARDINGNFIFEPEELALTAMPATRRYFTQKLAKVIHEDGLGTEGGGFLVNAKDMVFTRRMGERNVPLIEKFGGDMSNTELEMRFDMYDHGGEPIVDENMMTELPGLFDGRGATANGRMGGAYVCCSFYWGPYVGHSALEYAKNAEPLTDIDMSGVLAEYDRLNGIRTFTCNDSITPFEVRRAIQDAGLVGMDVYRTDDTCNEALAMLKDVRENLLPRMAVRDTSPCFNMEWKQAIETYNLLDICEMSIRATLERKETRGDYLRGDYPEMDDENWFCTLLCYNRDGEMQFEKRELPEYVPFEMPAA